MIVKNSVTYHYLKKKIFFSRLNMEDINDADHTHAKRVCKYHLCSKRYILMLTDVFENFRNMCLNIYELNPAHFITATCLS